MQLLRKVNFKDDMSHKSNWRDLTDELLSQQIEYHNNATYKAFEFYIKMLLAILSGIALLATKAPPQDDKIKFLLDATGWVVVLVSFLITLLIFAHQKSKIERWKRGYLWYEPLMWNECWFIASVVTVAMFTRWTMIPALLK